MHLVGRERVPDRNSGKPAEVLVGRKELANAMLSQERGDVCVVGEIAGRAAP